MSSKDNAISVRGLSKSYLIAHNANRPTNLREAIVQRIKHPLGVKGQERETFWALNGVDLDIRPGESVGIIGRNGAGKSTLLKILSRITYPTKGVLDIYGRVASLLEVGTGFHGELTGRENIFLNASILGMSRREIRKKFDEIVAFAEVENFLDTPVKRYSSGMYVRLAFAVAAHLDPEILIVDEVLAVGDFAFQKKCLGKMQEVSGAGRTVLFVSHNLTTVSSLCQRAVWMNAGRLYRDGPASEVVEAYLSSSMDKTDEYYDLRSLDGPTAQSRRYGSSGSSSITAVRFATMPRSGWTSITRPPGQPKGSPSVSASRIAIGRPSLVCATPTFLAKGSRLRAKGLVA